MKLHFSSNFPDLAGFTMLWHVKHASFTWRGGGLISGAGGRKINMQLAINYYYLLQFGLTTQQKIAILL